MSAAIAAAPTTPRPGSLRPLAGIALRQYWVPGAILLLLALRIGVQIVYHYHGWADAVALRNHVGSQAYHFGRYTDDAHTMTAKLMDDGAMLAFQPALCAALLTGVLTAREWETRRVVLALTQTVTPRRWFGVRWATLAAVFVVLTVPLVALYRMSAGHALGLDLLTYGAERQNAYYTIGPVTVAYVLLGVAAGALTGTFLRRLWPTLVAAPLLTWLVAAVLVRSRAMLLLDLPVLAKVPEFHSGGVFGLMFYDALPQDALLTNILVTGDYWPYQLASSALVLVVAALLTLAAFRVIRRRTA
ncbi:hypothetical protein ABZX97_00615 [Streptomyces seoulensis]|uniref:hypothetical protein n=1 Tax=Streptomyces seoulensis TaxID=73044 RepID=UPI0033A3F562